LSLFVLLAFGRRWHRRHAVGSNEVNAGLLGRFQDRRSFPFRSPTSARDRVRGILERWASDKPVRTLPRVGHQGSAQATGACGSFPRWLWSAASR
jgi:hypothetical protein